MNIRTAVVFLVLWCPALAFQSSFIGKGLEGIHGSSRSTLKMQIPIVDNWRILANGSVVGVVRNHPVIKEGDTIQTSPLENAAAAKERQIVQTYSGSKYRLGFASSQQKKANGKVQAAAATPKQPAPIRPPPTMAGKLDTSDAKALEAALRQAKADYKLTGKVIGNGKYLLAGKSKRSTSGRSSIYTCYLNDGTGLPVGGPLCAKISSNKEALERETNNYKMATTGLNRGQFVKFFEYIERAGDDKTLSQQGVIIIERGVCDLKKYLEENGPLQGKQLRDAAVACVECLQACHSANLIWTDMKAENFVVTDMSDLAIRGIDLESAMPIRDNPIDYSPEACPPEFADAFLSGDGPYFVLATSYDVWSLGMILYELSTGTTMFGGKNPTQITKILKDPAFSPDTSAVPDNNLQDLIKSCLQKDPKKRPSLGQILLHPFFLTTGIGPFSW